MKKRHHRRRKRTREPLLGKLFPSKDERKTRMKERHYTTLETTVNLQPYGNFVKRRSEAPPDPPRPEPAIQQTPSRPRVQKLTIWNPW